MLSRNEIRLVAFNEEGKENVEAVCGAAKKNGFDLKTVWLSPEDASKVSKLSDDVVYIVDPFHGEEEEELIAHLVNLKYPVMGPRCAITVLNQRVQLDVKTKFPLYTLTMHKTMICFSNIVAEERQQLINLVELMGGEVSRELYDGVTHLVAGEVGSVKYFAAAKCGIKIVVKDWIHYLWKHGVSQSISAMKGEWDDYRCPVFLGCSVSSTGFNVLDKTSIQKMITKHGGEYTGPMKLNVTTHLIAHKPEGQKYNSAYKFGVKVVNINWLYDSIEKKACQDNEEYIVKSEEVSKETVNQSTPEKKFLKPKVKIGDAEVSCIGPLVMNETVQSTMSDTAMSSFNISRRNDSFHVGANAKNDAAVQAREKLLSFPNGNYGNILDGIYVFLTGFSVVEGEKIRRLLSLSNAIIYNQLTSSVSHVIVGPAVRLANAVKNSVTSVYAQNPELQTIRYTWVLECLETSELVPEVDHWAEELLPVPLDDAGEETLEENSTFSTTRSTLKKKPKTDDTTIDQRASVLPFLEDDDMLSQYYAHDATMKSTTMSMQDDNETAVSEVSAMPDVSVGEEHNMDGGMEPSCYNEDVTGILDVTDLQEENPVHNSSDCFNRKTFFLFGFDGEKLEDKITAIKCRGGNVLPLNSKQVGDYAVVPLTGWLVNRTVQDVVTDFWLDLCLSLNKLVSPTENAMCTPFSIPNNSKLLEGCVACLSKFQPPERTYLANLIQDLGGICQDSVARRKVRNLEATTHLIISEPGGEKYSGCKSWGIYTLTEEWVYESARKGQKMKEDDFSVDKPKKKNTAAHVKKDLEVKKPVQANRIEFQRKPNPVDKIRQRLEMQAEAKRRAEEEAKKNAETPLAVRYKRLNLETPSKFMRRDKGPVNVTFDLTEVFELLKTPVEQQDKIRENIRKNPETPMSEVLSRFLDEAVAKIPPHLIQNLERKLEDSIDDQDQTETVIDDGLNLQVTEDQSTSDEAQEVVQKNAPSDDLEERDKKIFEGLVVCLAKKFHKKYPELCKTVKLHGGEFRWTYDNAVTHYLFEGRTNNKNKELVQARKDEKFVVSPYWIQASVQTKCRIDEALFPFSYDPNNSLQVVTSTSPSQSRRRTLRSSASTSSGDSPRSAHERDRLNSTTLDKEQNIETEDSQETREKLRRKLEHVMSTANIRRETHSHRLSCNNANTSSPAAAMAQRRSSVSSKPTEMTNLDSLRNELSQDVQVSWDDPTGREELERLKRECKIGTNNSALGMSNCSAFNTWGKESTINDITYHDGHVTTEPTSVIDGIIPCFMVTSVQDKTKYLSIITKLGGSYKDDFEKNVTHLIVGRPSRTEKCLTALACGIWVLDSKYLDACEQAQKFLQEDEFEFGNPKNPETNMLGSPGFTDEFKMSCHRWRCILQKKTKELGIVVGAFYNWKLVLNVQARMLKAFKNVLTRGGATILSERLPYEGNIDDLTHILIDEPKRRDGLSFSDLEGLVSKVHICEITFIGDYLIKDPPPQPESFIPNELKEYLERMDEGGRERKRIKLQ